MDMFREFVQTLDAIREGRRHAARSRSDPRLHRSRRSAAALDEEDAGAHGGQRRRAVEDGLSHSRGGRRGDACRPDRSSTRWACGRQLGNGDQSSHEALQRTAGRNSMLVTSDPRSSLRCALLSAGPALGGAAAHHAAGHHARRSRARVADLAAGDSVGAHGDADGRHAVHARQGRAHESPSATLRMRDRSFRRCSRRAVRRPFGDWSLVRREDGSQPVGVSGAAAVHVVEGARSRAKSPPTSGLTETAHIRSSRRRPSSPSTLLPPDGWRVARFSPAASMSLPDGIDAAASLYSSEAVVLTDVERLHAVRVRRRREKRQQNVHRQRLRDRGGSQSPAPALAAGSATSPSSTRADGSRNGHTRNARSTSTATISCPAMRTASASTRIGASPCSPRISGRPTSVSPRSKATATRCRCNGMTLYGGYAFEQALGRTKPARHVHQRVRQGQAARRRGVRRCAVPERSGGRSSRLRMRSRMDSGSRSLATTARSSGPTRATRCTATRATTAPGEHNGQADVRLREVRRATASPSQESRLSQGDLEGFGRRRDLLEHRQAVRSAG